VKRYYLRILLIGIFLFSAFVKAYDFDATAEFFSSLSGATVVQTKILLSLIVLVEIFVAGVILLEVDRNKYMYRIITGLLCSFFVFSLLFWILGVNSCGCFGTIIIMPPAASTFKNNIVMILFHLISKNSIRRYRRRILSA